MCFSNIYKLGSALNLFELSSIGHRKILVGFSYWGYIWLASSEHFKHRDCVMEAHGTQVW